MSSEAVHLELTKDEAVVLFEFLSRFEDTERLKILDKAEERSLRTLQGRLESQLVEIFMPNYLELVQQARDRLCGVEVGDAT